MNSHKLLGIGQLIIGFGMLLYATYFNLDLYKLEPTATIDPNDNTFQYALVDRANVIWDYAAGECKSSGILYPFCHLTYMVDHWVHNWNGGYNLPFYYSHIPQLVIVGSYRLLIQPVASLSHTDVSLFQYFHWIIYLLMCLFPLAVFLAVRVIGLSWLAAGFGALIASHISTDGLYGLDPPSFLWRGYGLSSQLFAMLWMPLAIAFSYRYFQFPTELLPVRRHFFAELMLCLPFLRKNGSAAKQHLARNGKKTIGDSRLRGNDSVKGTTTMDFWLAVLFIVLSIMGHLGIGIIVVMSTAIFAYTPVLISFFKQESIYTILSIFWKTSIKLLFLVGTSIFFMSYWIIPTVLGNDYHNISFWDPVWKFNSYGWKEIVIRFLNGDLFDWGRESWMTALVIIGLIACIQPHKKQVVNSDALTSSNQQLTTNNLQPNTNNHYPYLSFALLFLFWLVMYFGRTTWGGLIDLIPGMKEFHLSRFLVGLHLVSFFVIPSAVSYLLELLSQAVLWFVRRVDNDPKKSLPLLAQTIISLVGLWIVAATFLPPIYQQTIYYNELNDRLIKQANENYLIMKKSEADLFAKFASLPPARIFAGRGGGWGKIFEIAETPMNMNLSTYGFPVPLWMPETWSPNADVEQFFSENVAADYNLFNMRYVVTPTAGSKWNKSGEEVTPQSFWKELYTHPDFTIYEVPTSGYFMVGRRTQMVITDKTHFVNIVHLWIQSKLSQTGLFPQLVFPKEKPTTIPANIPVITMTDVVTYKNAQGQSLNIFANNPLYNGDPADAQIEGPEVVVADMKFKTKVTIGKNCRECLVVLKQTSHPNWEVKVNGDKVNHINVFPFYIGIPLSQAGTYDIEVAYRPSELKSLLLALQFVTLGALVFFFVRFFKSLRV